MPLSVLVVPRIATPLKIANLVYQAVEQLPYLQGLEFAHPITHSSDFEITVLIGADFYWQVVEDKIIRGNGPTTVQPIRPVLNEHVKQIASWPNVLKSTNREPLQVSNAQNHYVLLNLIN